MKRRAPNEIVQPFRTRDGIALRDLRDRIAAWAQEHIDTLKNQEPEMPAGIVDRPADVWEPIIIIGDAAGEPWASRLRSAATMITMNDDYKIADAESEIVAEWLNPVSFQGVIKAVIKG